MTKFDIPQKGIKKCYFASDVIFGCFLFQRIAGVVHCIKNEVFHQGN